MVLLGATGAAHADDDHPFERPHPEVGLGMYVGGFDVGPIGGPAVALHTEVGYRWGNLMVFGEYAFAGIGESEYDNPDAVRGHLHRTGANARFVLGDVGGDRDVPLRGAMWLEAGAGHQHVRWKAGGKLDRNDVAFGFGGEIGVRHGRTGHDRMWSVYWAFRALVARAPDVKDMPPTCAGPCDEPTGPMPYDLGLFFNMGFAYGR